ncbi:hypothetical protein P873_02185 [Arenimonas composti TR7-09 = DSM 18010]|uniref:Uncharacterized protein n=2 Tax=Arenimonas TaxID=490567 RepID=A0A091B0L9_9GAMM|nr:hypothetical protein P873_02185 [Arenimonas composti TR7-09 = DSM 18010]
MSSTGLANLQLAQSYLTSGELDQALSRARRAERSDPGSPDVQIVLGMIHDRAGDPAEAGRHFARALALAPDAGHVLNANGAFLCGAGKRAEGEALLRRAADDRFFGQRERAFFNAGKCAFEAGDNEKAADYLRAGLALKPQDPRLLELMARVQFARGDFLGARAFFQRRDALGDTGPELLDLAARIEQAAGDAQAAARYRGRLAAEHPGYRPGAEGGR